MPSGKATGPNRDYQVFVKDVLIRRNPNLTSYQEDGVDVAFNINDVNATMTMDIALQGDQGDLIVGECKRWKSPVKQNEIFAFQKKIEELRKVTGKAVSCVFFVKHAFQLGAIKFADYYGIKVITCNERQPLEGFSLTNLHYDPVREKNFVKVKRIFQEQLVQQDISQ